MHNQPPKSPTSLTPMIRGDGKEGGFLPPLSGGLRGKTRKKISSYLLPLSGQLQGDFENFTQVGVLVNVYDQGREQARDRGCPTYGYGVGLH